MAISYVENLGETLIDLRDDTAVESDVAQGKTFHLADGTIGVGTATGGGKPTGTTTTGAELNTVSTVVQTRILYNKSSTSLDFTGIDTSEFTSMQAMFSKCFSLTSLDVTSFNTSNVTDMKNMFQMCNLLTNLDLSSFNTSNVTSMGGMFYECSSLTNLDIRNFDFSNVNSSMATSMFYNVPSNCVITVKNQIAKDFLINNASTMKLVLTDMNTQIVIAGN